MCIYIYICTTICNYISYYVIVCFIWHSAATRSPAAGQVKAIVGSAVNGDPRSSESALQELHVCMHVCIYACIYVGGGR